MDILTLHRNGISQRQIAKKLGISRPTVKKYLMNPDLISRQGQRMKRETELAPFLENISAWLNEDMEYSAVWIFQQLQKIGHKGGYKSVQRFCKQVKLEKGRLAYIRFETEIGRQAQVDFGEFQVQMPDGSVRKFYLFTMVLGYSRKLYGEFVERANIQNFLDAHIRAFVYFGGVPKEILYDRMKNVYLGKFSGKRKFNQNFLDLAIHYHFKPLLAPAYAPWVKGKVERPYHFVRENFWRGYVFQSLSRLQIDFLHWLKEKDQRVHGTTHEVVEDRFQREQPHLSGLPEKGYDTSWRIWRKVRKDCTVVFERSYYVLPHHLVGQTVLLRVKDGHIRIYAGDRLIICYRQAAYPGQLVQDPKFYADLKKDRELNRRKYAHGKKGKGKATYGPYLDTYELLVEHRPLSAYNGFSGEIGP